MSQNQPQSKGDNQPQPNNLHDHITPIVHQLLSKETEMPISMMKPDSDLNTDLGLDSLSTVSVAMDIEDHYNIVLNDADVEKCETVGELCTLTQKVWDAKCNATPNPSAK